MSKCTDKFSIYDFNKLIKERNIKTNKKNTSIILAVAGRGRRVRLFKYKSFNPAYTQGFVKLILINKELYVKVVDTYGYHTEDEEVKYKKDGYLLVGYQTKIIDIESEN